MEQITIRRRPDIAYIDYVNDTSLEGVVGHTSILRAEVPGVRDVLRLLGFRRVPVAKKEVYIRGGLV